MVKKKCSKEKLHSFEKYKQCYIHFYYYYYISYIWLHISIYILYILFHDMNDDSYEKHSFSLKL